MEHATLKTIHIFGVILFIGNIVVTAFWKALADRTRDVGVIRYVTRMVNLADIFFTVGGIAIILVTGHMMAPAFGGVMRAEWIRWSYVLIGGSGALWLAVLVPVQIVQARMMATLSPSAVIPARYWALSKVWMVAGSMATLLPLPAIYLMTAKPL